MNGVPEEIIRRAEDLVLLSMKGDDLVIACCQMQEDEVEELKEAVRRCKRSRTLLTWSKERIARDFLKTDVDNDPRASLSEILAISTITDLCV